RSKAMTTAIQTETARATTKAPHVLVTAILATLGAAATAWYGAYGDSRRIAEQVNAVPFLIGADVVISALVFGLLVPWAAGRGSRAAGWGLATGIVAIVATPLAFWSGVPLLFGAAGVLLGLAARRAAGGKMATSAIVVGAVSMTLATAMVVIGTMLP